MGRGSMRSLMFAAAVLIVCNTGLTNDRKEDSDQATSSPNSFGGAERERDAFTNCDESKRVKRRVTAGVGRHRRQRTEHSNRTAKGDRASIRK